MNYTPDEIAELLKDRPNQPHYIAAMVREAVEAERERCAALCDELIQRPANWDSSYWNQACERIAMKIRAS